MTSSTRNRIDYHVQQTKDFEEVKKTVAKLRDGTIEVPVDGVELYRMFLDSNKSTSGIGGMTPTWRRDLMYLLATVDLAVPYWMLCKAVGVSDSLVYLRRKQDRALDDAVRAYRAAFYEREATNPQTDLAPSLVIFGLKSQAGWRDRLSEAIDPDRLRALIDSIITEVQKLELDPDKTDRFAAALHGRFSQVLGESK